jgi:hypothetical protein
MATQIIEEFKKYYGDISFDDYIEKMMQMLLAQGYIKFSDVDLETILVKGDLLVSLSSTYEFVYCTNRVTGDYARIYGDYIDEGEIEELLTLMLS